MSGSLTLDAYAAASARTSNPSLDASDALMDAASGLAEEAGEVLAHVRKQRFQARPLDTAALAEELGDALWCLAAVARGAGLSLGAVASANLAKLAERHPGGFGTVS